MGKRNLLAIVLIIGMLTLFPNQMLAADTLRIGALFPLSGPVALHGTWNYNGLLIATELVNQRGGLWGKKIELVTGDAVDSKGAVSEATRLITYEKVPLIIGTFSSARAVPASEVANRHKVIYWETAAEAERLTGRSLDDVFRVPCRSTLKGYPPVDYIINVVAPALKKDPKDLRIGIFFEHGDYGTDTSNAHMQRCREKELKIALALSHDPGSLDFSSDIMRLKAAKLDFLYIETFTETQAVFWRQAKELGLHVAGGYSSSGVADGLNKLLKGRDSDYLLDCENPSQVNPDFLVEKARRNIDEYKKRYQAKFKEEPPYVSYNGFNYSMVLYENVLPRAKSLDPEAVRKAAMEIDIPERELPFAHGVKFYPPGHPQQGQNERAWPVMCQYQNGKMVTVWPAKVAVSKPWCPVPSWAERAKK